MELKEELESRSAPRIKKAAAKIYKQKLAGYEAALLSALEYLTQKPKSWQAQSEVIKALGVTGSNKSLPYLEELVGRELGATLLYRDLAFSICLLSDIPNKKLEYTIKTLGSSNDLLVSGTCAAILFSGYIPSEKEMTTILASVQDRDENEGQIMTPRCFIAAACYSWPAELTKRFLQKCTESTWQGLVEIANESLAGRRSQYVLI